MRARLFLLALVAITPLTATSARSAHAAPPWVDRNLTLPASDWAFDFGLGLAHVPPPPVGPPDEITMGANAEMAVGVTSRLELGFRTALRFGDAPDRGVEADKYGRLFDRQTFDTGAEVLANPEFRVRGALVRESVFELALEGRLVLPFEAGTAAGVLFGVPMAFHLGSIVRLDMGVYMPVIFSTPDAEVDLRLPIDVWIQATDRLWLGPMTGLEFDRINRPNGTTNLSLGFGLGYQFTHALDLKTMFLFPAINQESGDFGIGVGIQVRID
jgi:hypothetical protein